MVTVTKEHKKKWGSQFSDRDNSFDDDEDIKFFIQHTTTDRGLQSLILRNLPERGNYEWVGKPDNKYGIDLALVDKDTREKILLVDLERWGEWGSAKNNYDWPYYYRFLHFLGRKDHFLDDKEPFMMIFLSRNRDKLIVVEQETIKKYRTISKYFKGKGVWDDVKEMRMSDGYIFGKNLTPRELDNMSVYEE